MASKPQTRREAIKSGRAKVATDIAESESLGPVVNPDGTPTAVTVEMLTGSKPEAAEVPAGSVLITMQERDHILASGDKALVGRVERGVYVRPNGKAPAGPVKGGPGDKANYYPRWRLAITLTPAMLSRVATVEADPEWGWKSTGSRTVTVTESASGAPALRRAKAPKVETEAQAKVRRAKALVAEVDTLPGPEHIAAIGTPEVQDALETIGGSREVGPDEAE